MKFVLYLLSCCIVVSWQQHPRYWKHPDFQPHQHFFDPYYQHSDPYYNAPYQKQDWRHYQHFYPSPPSLHSYDNNYDPAEENQSNDQVELDDGNEKDAQFRTFFFPKAVLAGQVYRTYTTYSITTTTISSTSIISCIPSGSFFGGSTQTCSRRKRLHKELQAPFDAENADGSLLRPTPVASIEATATTSSFINALKSEDHQELESSQFKGVEEETANKARSLGWLWGNRFGGRNGYYYGNYGQIYGRTTTSTLTSFSIISTVSKRTISTLGSSLSCLPSGYSIC